MNVLAISDLQTPFQHRDAFSFVTAVAARYHTNLTVNIGDEIDFHAMSDWSHDPDGFSAGHELEAAINEMKYFYREFPKTYVCTSNHTDRPWRKALKDGTPAAFLRSVKEVLKAPKGWNWREYWEFDGVRYEHGEGYSGKMGAHKAAVENGQSTVIGHIHAHAGIQYSANPQQLFFGFNVGCLIDNKKYAFKYNKKFKYKPIVGCGVVIDGVPLFVPMKLNKKGFWTGRL